MFSELITTVEENGKGTHAFRKAANIGRARTTGNGELAAAWLLLASIAELFVEQNERMAITTIQIDQWFKLLQTEVERLNTAFSNSDAKDRLEALNKTAQTLVNQAA